MINRARTELASTSTLITAATAGLSTVSQVAALRLPVMDLKTLSVFQAIEEA